MKKANLRWWKIRGKIRQQQRVSEFPKSPRSSCKSHSQPVLLTEKHTKNTSRQTDIDSELKRCGMAWYKNKHSFKNTQRHQRKKTHSHTNCCVIQYASKRTIWALLHPIQQIGFGFGFGLMFGCSAHQTWSKFSNRSLHQTTK